LHPEEKDFMRLATLITTDECKSCVATPQNLSEVIWNDIQNEGSYHPIAKRCVALCKWNNQNWNEKSKPTFQQLYDALNSAKVTDKHALCKVGNNCSHMYCLTVY
jgi:hypothetical protein